MIKQGHPIKQPESRQKPVSLLGVMDKYKNNNNPVILLGGLANATSAARSFGRHQIPVTIISRRNNPALHSRHVTEKLIIPDSNTTTDYLTTLFLEQDRFPVGTVIFPCGDEEILFVAKNKKELSKKYIFDIQIPEQQMDLLDKKKTLQLAKNTGCFAPGFWDIDNVHDLNQCIESIVYPVLIKPIHSHVFQKKFNRKLFYIENRQQLEKLSNAVFNEKISFMLCEFIPGPDSLLNSYYVYIDEQNNRLFEFTKRVIRRSPPNFGAGAYHITEWLPQTAEMGYRFFSGIGFKGLGNIEFKTDPRDGQLKVIECNARFTGAQELITRSGLDMPLIIYRYLTSGARPEATDFKNFLTLWLPLDDFDSYRALSARGELTFLQWLKSVSRRQVFSYFQWQDPGPFIADFQNALSWRLSSLKKKAFKH